MNFITLSRNHKRSVSASLHYVEQLIVQLEVTLKFQTQTALTKHINDFETEDVYYKTIKKIETIKSYIEYLQQKYQLSTENVSMKWELKTNKTKIWEILSDANVKKMKGFGETEVPYAEEFDNDMHTLIELTEKL